MKIYTRTGDNGQTSLVGGKRISKASARLEAYGTVDELNSHLGLLAATAGVDLHSIAFLQSVQNRLFNLGAYLATDNAQGLPAGIDDGQIQAIEQEIDRLEATLPQLRSFILPGGCLAAAQANVARAVCRRAERRTIALDQQLRSCSDTPPLHPLAITYLNRLSDYLFNLGRHLNNLTSTPEIPWKQ